MADDRAQKNLKAKQIWQIVISGAIVTVVIAISGILISCDSKQTEPATTPPPPSIVTLDEVQTELQKCTLFFFDTNSLRLAGEERELHLSQDVTERLKQTITALLGDSISGLYQTIPEGTALYEVYIDEQLTTYLDFSHHLKDGHIGGTTGEALTVSAILRTIKANFPNQIRKVQILIEGLETDTIGGHIDISKPLVLALELEVVSGAVESTAAEATEGEPMEGEPEEGDLGGAALVEEESEEVETLETDQVSGQETD